MTTELEKELVEFYLEPNSAREIERKYGINWYQLKKILAKYKIPQHSRSDAYKLRDERTKEVCLERYGVENPFAAEEVKEKIKQSMLEHHGVEYVGQAEISKQKSKEVLLDKYGVDHYSKTEEFKKNYTANSAKYKIKEFKSKKLNGTCNTSKAEEHCYEILKAAYGAENILRQYQDSRYPYHCDFYIVPEDLFIELNFSWTHGKHPFDATNTEDLNTLAYWQEKAKTSQYYKNAITTWTIRDTAKLAIAKANKLNYVIYYKESELFEQYS
jgi:hypothetical protein